MKSTWSAEHIVNLDITNREPTGRRQQSRLEVYIFPHDLLTTNLSFSCWTRGFLLSHYPRQTNHLW